MQKKKRGPQLSLYILSGLCAATLLSHFLFQWLDQKWKAPVSFSFSLPFPPDIVTRYNLTNQLEIEKIIIAGPFSDWNGFNDAFRMQQSTGGSWTIDLRIPPGPSQYKYVVHTSQPVFDSKDQEWRRQIWVQDVTSRRMLPDSFGGFNSLVVIPDISEIRRITYTLLLGMSFIMLLFLLIRPLMRRILRIPRSYRFKLVLITGIILLTSNVLFIVYNILELRIISHQAYIDTSHFLLQPLLPFFKNARQYRHADLNRLQGDIDALLDDTYTRNEKNKFSLNQFNISSVMVMDTNFQPLVFSIRRPSEKLQLLLMPDTGYTNLVDMFRYYYYEESIRRLKKLDNPFQQPIFTLARLIHNPERPQVGTVSRLFIGFDTMIIPVKLEGSIRFYAFFSLHTDLLGMEVQRILAFNGILLLVSLGLMFFLLFDLGGVLSQEIRKLLRGIDEVMQGNLDYYIRIETGDEFESLSQAYNTMRLSIRDLRENLENKVEERTLSLNQALEKLNQANILLEQQARIDGLTQVYNRRSLDEILDYELLRARREKQYLGLLLLDLDHFKAINDRYGHQAGDQALIQVAALIRDILSRATDEIGRYGGEEFCIVLPYTDPQGVAVMAEKIRSQVESLEIQWDGQPVKVRTSIGTVTTVPGQDCDREVFYRRADQALYTAKSEGRNRVVAWQDESDL